MGKFYRYAAEGYQDQPYLTSGLICANLAANTTAHGPPRIYNSKGICKIGWWVILCLVCLGVLVFHIYTITSLYTRHPVRVVVSEHQVEELDFPAVTVCNMSPVRKSLWEAYLDRTSDKVISVRRKRSSDPDTEFKECPDGWVVTSGRCFLITQNASVTWLQARDTCFEYSAGLATIDSATIQQLFTEGSELWTGLYQKLETPDWFWMDDKAADWMNWESWEPNGNGACVRASWQHDFRWLDKDCDGSKYMVACSIDLSRVCPLGWLDSGVRCYRTLDNEVTGNEASTLCKHTYPGATLARVDTLTEQAWLETKLFNKTDKRSYWIGLQQKQSTLKWVGGENVNYSKWDVGEPRNLSGCMFLTSGRFWRLGDCAVGRGFVCEKDQEIKKTVPMGLYIPEAPGYNVSNVPAMLTKDPDPITGSDFPDRLPLEEMFKMEEEFIEALAEIKDFDRTELGFSLLDLILDCQFEGLACGMRDFTSFFNPIYGNCYTFNSAWNGTENCKGSKHTGRRHGLHLTMNINQDDYTPETDSAGIRLVVHPGDSMPFPEEDGITLPPGRVTYVGLSKVNTNRLDATHGECIDTTESNTDRNIYEEIYNVKYSKMGCQKTCLQQKIMEECKCWDAHYLYIQEGDSKQETKICSAASLQDADCKHKVMKMIEDNKFECSCPNACSSTDYSLKMSAGPSDVQRKPVLDRIAPQIPDLLNDPKDPDKIKRNLLKVEVYYEAFKYENITEEPAYKTANYMSDLGGALGLWFGLSVLTICEVVEFIADILVFLCARACNGDSQKVEDSGNAAGSVPDAVHHGNALQYNNPYMYSNLDHDLGLTQEQVSGYKEPQETHRPKKVPDNQLLSLLKINFNDEVYWRDRRNMKIKDGKDKDSKEKKKLPPPYYLPDKKGKKDKKRSPPPAYVD